MLRRGLLLTTVMGLLALAGCTPSTNPAATGTSVVTNPAPTGSPVDRPASTASVHVRDFTLDPGAVAVTGGSISLAVTNDGPTVHNVTVRDASGTVLFGTKDLREGQSEMVAHDIAPGSYVLFCSLPGHESLGVKGTLTVTAP